MIIIHQNIYVPH